MSSLLAMRKVHFHPALPDSSFTSPPPVDMASVPSVQTLEEECLTDEQVTVLWCGSQ